MCGNAFRDGDGEFAATYGTAGVERAAYLIRPDGYVGPITDDIGRVAESRAAV